MIINGWDASGKKPNAFDLVNGKVYHHSRSYNSEDGTAITRVRRFGPVEADINIFHSMFKLKLEAKHDSSASYTMSMTLKWSEDRGLTWNTGATLSKDITNGTSGQLIKLREPNLGLSDDRYYELSMTGPAARMVFDNPTLELTKGRS